MSRIIVSRHPAAIQFIARELGAILHREEDGRVSSMSIYPSLGYAEQYPVLAEAAPDDVRGKVVYGNLPLHLAALATEVHAIEFQPMPCLECTSIDRALRGDSGPCQGCGGTGIRPGSGKPPRGAEYTLADMDAAGAKLQRYVVVASGSDLDPGSAYGLRSQLTKAYLATGAAKDEVEALKVKWRVLDQALLAAGVGRADDLIADYRAMIAREQSV